MLIFFSILFYFFFFKQKTAYEMRISDWSSDVCSSDLLLYVVISTQGDGNPPEDALGFVEFLRGRKAPRLDQLAFAVLGLGDSSYPQFCAEIGRASCRERVCQYV